MNQPGILLAIDFEKAFIRFAEPQIFISGFTENGFWTKFSSMD